MSKKRKKNRWGGALIGLGVVLCLAGLVLTAYRGVRPVAALEFGEELSPALFTEQPAALAEPYEGVNRQKGRHVLFLSVDHRPVDLPVLVEVADTVAPAAEPVQELIVPLGETLTPDRLLTGIRDNDVVEVYFGSDADFVTVGPHRVTVVMEDATGNRAAFDCGYRVRGVVDQLTIEAGDALPDAAAFLISDPQATGAALVSDYTEALTHHAGTYALDFHFQLGDQRDRAYLTVTDTAAPTGQGISVTLLPGDSLAPERFVVNSWDETDLRFDFALAPDLSCHDPQPVIVRLTDEGGNTAEVTSEITITTLTPVTLEASQQPPTGQAFGLDGEARVEEFPHAVPGTYLVKLWLEEREEAAVVTVLDTTAPLLTAREVGTRYIQHPLTPEEMFDAQDVSPLEVSFQTAPDWAQVGEQEIIAVATDAYGNQATCTQRITLLDDPEPPRLYGAVDRNVYKDESVAYLAGVYAEDDVDGAVEITVSTDVDIHQEGSYAVRYTAADRCGNETSAACTFTVIAPTVTDEQVRELARSVMNEITTPDMVNAEKLDAIYWYVRKHVLYRNGVNKNYSDWRKAAYDGFTTGRGDCYNIWAVTRALLDEAGIEYESVERVKSHRRQTRHYWVHVNLGNGWYVFDPTWTPLHKFTCFMWTEAQCDSCRQYWQFDKTKHHALATERFDYDAVVLAERNGELP